MSSQPQHPVFLESEQLYSDVAIKNGVLVSQKDPISTATLPGQPTIALTSPDLQSFLNRDLVTPDLDRMAPHLWLVATPSHTHVSALHHQIVRGRNIVISENPQLHLVWIDDRVFIKPLPEYLLSYPFWEQILCQNTLPPTHADDLTRRVQASLGYMRSWCYLVQHRSDFQIAQEAHLVPEYVEWPDFTKFLARFATVPNDAVSRRYHYGDLRLSRLNFWAKVFLRRWHFHKVHGQYWLYFARFYGPLLFVFAIFTLVLSAMQVILACDTHWTSFILVAQWFSVGTVLVVVVVSCFLLALLVGMGLNESVYAVRHRMS